MKVPLLLLDGALESNLRQKGMTADDCMTEWILDHEDAVKSMYEGYSAGCSDILCTPTAEANGIKLKECGLDEKYIFVNKQLVSMTKPYCKDGMRTAGILSTTGQIPEPFGDADFFKLFHIFLEQADVLKKSGADMLWIQSMTSLAELRTAIIACRRTGLPVYASVTLESDGKTASGATPLSCLICVQALGVKAFGFEYGDSVIIADAVKKIAPYAKIPIIARPDAGLESISGNYDIPVYVFAECAAECINNGASIIGGGNGTTSQHIMALRSMIAEKNIEVPDIEPYDESGQIIVASAAECFFLNTDSIETSEPLECSQDMADEIFELNKSSLDIITVQLNNYDDAFLFSKNSHFVSLPVMFSSSHKLALETALLLYNGRALIDSNCDIDEDTLKEIEAKYGAVIY